MQQIVLHKHKDMLTVSGCHKCTLLGREFTALGVSPKPAKNNGPYPSDEKQRCQSQSIVHSHQLQLRLLYK